MKYLGLCSYFQGIHLLLILTSGTGRLAHIPIKSKYVRDEYICRYISHNSFTLIISLAAQNDLIKIMNKIKW